MQIPIDQPVTGANERCIEWPLGLAVVALDQPGWVLDAGCAMNGHLPEGGAAHVVHLTQNIASEKAHCSDGLRSYVSADLRDLSLFADRAFDRTVCISTLEHVGMDNATYKAASEENPGSVKYAVGELCRVTRGVLLITVPFCREDQACRQWRYLAPRHVHLITDVATSYGFDCAVAYYAKTDKGWYGGGPDPLDVPAGDMTAVNHIVTIQAHR